MRSFRVVFLPLLTVVGALAYGWSAMLDAEAAKTTDIVLQALKTTGLRAVLHGGWSELGSQQLPENVLVRYDF